MASPSKQKGNRYERELVQDAEARGLPAERAYASNGRALGKVEEVDCIVAGCCIQAKRRKALPKFLQLDPGVDAVVFRQDNGESLVLVSWKDFQDKIEETGGW